MQVLNKKYWPYQLRMGKEYVSEDSWERKHQMEQFCHDKFIKDNWRNVGLYFCFKRQDDAIFFALRFGDGN